MDSLEQAIQYFREEQGFKRLFELMIKKYKGLGRIGGSVKLTRLSLEEKQALSAYFRHDYSKQSSITVSIEKFERLLENTKFGGVGLKELLEGYIGQDILTKAEEHEIVEAKKKDFFQELYREYKHPNSQLWLKHIEKRGLGTKGIYQAYDHRPPALKQHLSNVLAALNKLPLDNYQRLPVFANDVCGDPHGFDVNSEQGRLLVSALEFLRGQEDTDYEPANSHTAEEVRQLHNYFGIVGDDILNFVTCAGLLAFASNETKPLLVWESAWKVGFILNIPLREILKVDTCIPAITLAKPKQEAVVFIVENSGVFSEILDRFGSKELPPIICTHGQFKLASWVLRDKLVKSGVTIYYSGDFDPEGLQIAQRLLKRYPKNVKLWRYTIKDYQSCIPTVELNEARLNKLGSVTEEVFLDIKEKIYTTKKAVYQEELVSNLVRDIQSYIATFFIH